MTEIEGNLAIFFDTGRLWPYDCAPMSAPSVPRHIELRKLAAQDVELTGQIPQSCMERLRSLLVDAANQIDVRLEFATGERRRPTILGEARTTANVLCQRCLQPMDIDLDANIALIGIWSEEELQSVPREIDSIVVGEDKTDLYALLEEELLLSMPFSNVHAKADCDSVGKTSFGEQVPQAAPAQTRDNPFDVLKTLKKDDA
jgi:uncharacterized protein